MSVIELRDVSKVYLRGGEAVHALQSVSFSIEQGQMISLVGPSGCGKTTCLNLVAGVDRASEGRVMVCGVDLAQAGEAELTELRRRHVGMIFQSFHLMPHLSVEENVALPLALRGERDPNRVRDLLDRVGLSHRLRHYPAELSGGEQQRTAIARAIVHRPRVLLADEPTGNLDSRSGEAVLALLAQLRQEEGAAMIMVTHDDHVASHADATWSMRDGVLQMAERDEVAAPTCP